MGVVKHCSLDVRWENKFFNRSVTQSKKCAGEIVEINKKWNNYRFGIIKVHSNIKAERNTYFIAWDRKKCFWTGRQNANKFWGNVKVVLKVWCKKGDRLWVKKSVTVHGKCYAISDGDRVGNPSNNDAGIIGEQIMVLLYISVSLYWS